MLLGAGSGAQGRIQLSERQKEGVRTALTSKVAVLTVMLRAAELEL